MGDEPEQPCLARYLLELEQPYDGWRQLQLLTARARTGAEELSAEGLPVRFLRSIFVPEDGTCFFLYEAGSADTVGAAARRAQLAIRRIDPSIRISEREALP